jgi:hypothetical protein
MILELCGGEYELCADYIRTYHFLAKGQDILTEFFIPVFVFLEVAHLSFRV